MDNKFHEYAQYYDLLYQDKDYPGEARFIARLLDHVCGPQSDREILDLACGTGRHAEELTRLGYRVDGSDVSADMIAVARERAQARGIAAQFHNESFQTCDRIGRRYDAVIAMFASIDYLTEYRDLARALSNIRALLKSDGVFAFDFWNGNAVLSSYSPQRMKQAEKGDQAVMRTSRTSLDPISQVATVNFEFRLLRRGTVVREFSEVHRVRYFFPQEMHDLLQANGLELVHRCPFMQEHDPVRPDDWNITYVVRACA